MPGRAEGALSRQRCGGLLFNRGSLALVRPAGKRIVRGAQGDADRHAGHVEGFAQAVREIADIGLRHRIRPRALDDEAWRPRLGLRHIFDLQPAPGNGGRRVMRQDAFQPTVELAGGDAAVPNLVGPDDGIHQLVETAPGFDKLMDAVIRTHKVWNSRVSTGKLNRWLEGILAHHPPPAVAGRRLKIKYVTQAKTRPPGFVVQCSRPDAMPQSYVRYLSNSLREAFDMPGVPIRIALRTSDNPFAGRAKKR